MESRGFVFATKLSLHLYLPLTFIVTTIDMNYTLNRSAVVLTHMTGHELMLVFSPPSPGQQHVHPID